MLLNSKVCIVTGAARGIGAAIAKKLGENGAHVAFSYISDSSADKAAELENEIKSFGVNAKAYKTDAAIYAQSESFINDVLKDFGTIDICVNNAGVSRDNLLLRLPEEQWDKVMSINLKSVFNITKQVIRPMMKAKSGSIINMTSIMGMRGNPGQSAYSASKAGIIGFTKSIAKELGSRNVRSNAIAPGFIETDMTHEYKNEENGKSFLERIPLGRFGSTNEVAEVALFLASDKSSYITGQIISVCGGMNI